MNRQEFIKPSGKKGLGALLMPQLLASCSKEDDIQVNFTGKVIIVGAGSAGMMAAYTLEKYGIDYEPEFDSKKTINLI